MAYTPINWQTGDTITADKLNKMDNGWGYESTELFSETVTTVDSGGFHTAQLAYSQLITADSLIVTFDGTEYTCPSIGEGEYGAPWSNESNAYDFSVFPFNLYTYDGEAGITAQTAGAHTIAVTGSAIVTSNDFNTAVNGALVLPTLPLSCYEGSTTYADMSAALDEGKMMYIVFNNVFYFVSRFDSHSITTVPATQYVSFVFDEDGILATE